IYRLNGYVSGAFKLRGRVPRREPSDNGDRRWVHPIAGQEIDTSAAMEAVVRAARSLPAKIARCPGSGRWASSRDNTPAKDADSHGGRYYDGYGSNLYGKRDENKSLPERPALRRHKSAGLFSGRDAQLAQDFRYVVLRAS